MQNIYLHRLRKLIALEGLTGAQFRILTILIEACRENDSVQISFEALAATAKVNRTTIYPSINRLLDLGYIRKEKLTIRGDCQPNTYFLLFDKVPDLSISTPVAKAA